MSTVNKSMFFSTKKQYEDAKKILQRYDVIKSCDWETAEDFLMNLSSYENHLLDNIISYKEKK